MLENSTMSILKVARLGNPVLRKVAANVSQRELRSAPMQKFIDDMIETMKEYDGVGLAAFAGDETDVLKRLAEKAPDVRFAVGNAGARHHFTSSERCGAPLYVGDCVAHVRLPPFVLTEGD